MLPEPRAAVGLVTSLIAFVILPFWTMLPVKAVTVAPTPSPAMVARSLHFAHPSRPARPHPPVRRHVAVVLADLGRLRVTKYCSTGHRTSSDTWPRIGDIATLDRAIPFGTRVRIVGRDTVDGRWIDQQFVVTDRIGHGSDIDIYAGGEGDPSCEPRVNRTWGLQHLDVQIIAPARQP